MTKQKWSMWDVLFMVVAATWAILFFVLALHTYYSDSEIWLLTVSQKTLSPRGLPSIVYKFSFHLLTYLFSFFAPSELAVYSWARMGWATMGLGSLWMTARLFCRVHNHDNSQKWLWPLFIFLLTSTLYLNQGFRIRADNLCLFLHILYLTVFYSARTKGPRQVDFFILTFIHIFMMLASPKFILFTICQTVLCWYWANNELQYRKRLVWLLTVTALGPLTAACALILTASAAGYPNLLHSISSAADFYIKSFDTSLINQILFSPSDFYHFLKLPIRSPGHTILMLFWLGAFFFLLFKKKKDSVQPAAALQVYATLLFFMILLYNQKLPFFLGPFLTPVLAQAFCFLFSYLKDSRPQWALPAAALITAIVSGSAAYNFYGNYYFNSNIPQREFIQKLDDYTNAHPEARVYDIVGLLPRKNKIFIFAGPSEVAQKTKIIDSIISSGANLLLIVFKFKYLEPEFPPLLKKHWVPMGPDVWAAGRFINPLLEPKSFSKTRTFGEKTYWLMPLPKEKYYIDSLSHKTINSETILLDNKGLVTQSEAVTLAVPQTYMSLVLTDVAPIELPYRASAVFRFDTAF